ncbi:MAG: hypothetical protein ACLGIB_00220 [Actinomycetota bacterium]
MSLQVNEEALEVLRRSMQLANIGPDDTGGVRLCSVKALGGGTRIEVEFAAGLQPGETLVEAEGVRIFVDPSVAALHPEAVLTVEPQHERLVVLPAAD